jgi:hypothetical protein
MVVLPAIVLLFTAELGLLLDDMNPHLFEQGRIAIGKPDLQIVRIIAVFIDDPRGYIEGVKLTVTNRLAVNDGLAAAPDAEVHLG